MAISAQQLTIYLYSAHRAVIFAIAQLSCLGKATSVGSLTNERKEQSSRNVFSDCQINKGWVILCPNLGLFPLEQTRHVGVAKSEHFRLTNGETIFEEFQPM